MAHARKAAPQIGSLIPNILRQMQQEHAPLAKIQEAWTRLVGRELARHTRPMSLRRGRLVVHAERPGDNFTLNYLRPTLLRRLQTSTKGGVSELVIRAGELEPRAPAGPSTRIGTGRHAVRH